MSDRENILVAEDDSAVRFFVQKSLQSAGYSVTSVEDGQKALEALTTEPFNLLITDIAMPQVDGIALALKASQMAPKMPIVMISGYEQERTRAHNLKALVFQIVSKPFSLEEICLIAKEALNSVRL